MNRQKKTQLAIFLITPVLVLGVGAIDFYFFENLLYLVKGSFYLGLLLLFLFFVLPIRRWVIGGRGSPSSMLLWLGKIFLIEFGIISLFLLQKQVLFISFVNGSQISPALEIQMISHFLKDFFVSYYLFPWPLILVSAVIFSYSNWNISPVAPFSVFVPKKLITPFLASFTKAAINAYIHIATRLFLMLNLVGITYFFFLLLGNRFILFTPVGGIICSVLMYFLFARESSQKIFKKYQAQEISLGRLFIRFFISLFVVMVVTLFIIRVLQELSPRFSLYGQVKIFHLSNSWAVWQLILWAWWILGLPFIGSLLIKVSKGRTVTAFLIGTLIIPLIVSAVFGWLEHVNLFIHRVEINRVLLNSNLFAAIFFFCCLFLKGHRALLQMGGYSLQALRFKQRPLTDGLWQLAICTVIFLAISGVDLLQCGWILVALPTSIIFMIFSIWGCFIKPNEI